MKLLKVAVAALVMAAMVTPVIAEDRLSLNGEMRVGMFYLDDGAKDVDDAFAEQRLRIGGKIAVSENVSITFRTDFSEQTWGDNTLGRTAWQLDRAHLDLTKGIFHARIGQQTTLIGSQGVIDTQDTGAVLDIVGGLPIQLGIYSTDNNGANSADDFLTFATVSHKSDVFSVKAYAANARNRSAADDFKATSAGQAFTDFLVAADEAAEAKEEAGELKAIAAAFDPDATVAENLAAAEDASIEYYLSGAADDVYDAEFAKQLKDTKVSSFNDSDNAGTFAGENVNVFGLDFATTLDIVNIAAGFTMFDGDYLELDNAKDIDAMGTQFNLDVNANVSDSAMLGVRGYYAEGAGKNEYQVTYVGNHFNVIDPSNYGPLENEKLFVYDKNVYDFTGQSAGVVGGQLYGNIKLADATMFTGSIAYLEPEEDKNTATDSETAYNVGMAYDVMENVVLKAQLQYIDVDEKGADEKKAAGVRLYVNF